VKSKNVVNSKFYSVDFNLCNVKMPLKCSTWNLSCFRARSAAEPGVVLVAAEPVPDHKMTLCEGWLVPALVPGPVLYTEGDAPPCPAHRTHVHPSIRLLHLLDGQSRHQRRLRLLVRVDGQPRASLHLNFWISVNFLHPLPLCRLKLPQNLVQRYFSQMSMLLLEELDRLLYLWMQS